MSGDDGYYSDLEYTSGYFHELGPAHLRFCGLIAGIDVAVPEAPAYLELGMGQGVSLAVHAAANDGDFWGVDLGSAHVAHARTLVAAFDGQAQLHEDSFEAFAARDDLPQFDAITLHGVWSWVSDANRRILVDLIRDRLKPGGAVYLSYNCQPGWASRSPVRHLLKLGYEARPGGDAAGRIEAAMEFMEDVVAADGRFFSENRPAASHAASLRKVGRQYLAHEYMNDNWHVPYFSDVAGALAGAELSFVTSARLLDRMNAIQFQPAGQALLDRQKDPVLRESVRDFLVNQQFRLDVFARDARSLSTAEETARMDAQPFVLICGLDEIDFELTGAQGQAMLPQATYGPLALALAADDFRQKATAELITMPGVSALRRSDVVAALITLVGMGVLRPAQPFRPEIRARCGAYNRLVLDRAVTGPHLQHMASPVVGGGVLTPRSAQLFLRAWQAGARTTDEIALSVWDVFETTNERAVRDGRDLITREDNLARLGEMARRFVDQTVPLYRALAIL
ncbi:class I SAM-dependent methyltransferase [Brevundimonas sp. NIBR11]|uniref:class I SAM-dependent methyltransferase n=1 Tax=Brevundimonas sp. NIBR11 TaxID=3015999 RepID=UPI0022F0FA6C|nr:class I SAM-dependent methyltransferase [Brevundimonas sp. NIBR11]